VNGRHLVNAAAERDAQRPVRGDVGGQTVRLEGEEPQAVAADDIRAHVVFDEVGHTAKRRHERRTGAFDPNGCEGEQA
jgi:hypothetical protein